MNTTNLIKLLAIASVTLTISLVASNAMAASTFMPSNLSEWEPVNQPDSSQAAQAAAIRADAETKPVQFVRRLTQPEKFTLAAQPLSQSSKQYSLRVSGKEMMQGIELVTDADEALISISSAGSDPNTQNTDSQNTHSQSKSTRQPAQQLEPADIELSSAAGKMSAGDEKMTVSAKSESLHALYPEYFANTSAFRVASSLGHGNLQLRSVKLLADSSVYLVQVFDKHSNQLLKATALNPAPVENSKIQLTASINGKQPDETQAFWLDAKGNRIATKLSSEHDTMVAQIPTLQHAPGELVELLLETRIEVNGQTLRRDIKLPFALHQKTASLQSRIETSQQPGSVSFRVPLTVDQASRYEVRAVIQGTDKQGKRANAVMTYSADYLQPGERSLTTQVKKVDLLAAGLRPPFVISQLQLLDQGQIAELESRKLNQTLFQ